VEMKKRNGVADSKYGVECCLILCSWFVEAQNVNRVGRTLLQQNIRL
jgi:hypothetical protein